ncbi:polysaccharide deacetylase family protein [Geobacter pickeringii]|uniref:NodB homology domain-containing protein n=1 Tax=Geobacter pickeringii TaxID=345632 RepID=A0A0B5BHH0_9BACT|nr:polysaccharide deacetylase family protein [Geobacter pickeringii]AJE03481.1 hypothetical protein GPICK_09075 [Geobacter pickeringii]
MGTVIRNILGNALYAAFSRDASLPVAVISYHDISDGEGFSSWLRVNEGAFDKQISLLKDVVNFITPADLFDPDRLSRNRLNLLLTFDDGYSSTYRFAYPVIRKLQVPALFFISTWNMQTGQPFWFDIIISYIQEARIEALDLSHLGLGNYHFSSRADCERWDDIQTLLEDIKCHTVRDDIDFAEAVAQWLTRAFSPCTDARSCLPISPEQIAEMHRSGLCYFGSHSHRHRILTTLPDEALADDLRTSRKILEEVTGDAVIHVSYPNGNCDERVKRISREAGYRFGFTTSFGRVSSCTDVMGIPRLLVGGYDSHNGLIWRLLRGASRQSPRRCAKP